MEQTHLTLDCELRVGGIRTQVVQPPRTNITQLTNDKHREELSKKT